MKDSLRHIILVLGLALSLSGCAVYPAVQVAGGAMTGYDAAVLADEYLPRESVKGGELACTTDTMLQRRMRERLSMNQLSMVSAHVIEKNAYLVGQFSQRAEADRAIAIATSVKGIKVVNVKFYPLAAPRDLRNDTKLLAKVAKRLAETKRLKDADLRVEVIQGNAILIGSAGDYSQKTAALAIASEVSGVKDVVDYIVVRQQPEAEGKKVAAK